jgi:hypothetical protein
MADVRAVGKHSTNDTPGQKYKFRGIDAVMNAAGPAMRAHGVVVTPHRVRDITYADVIVGKNRTEMISVRVMVTYRIRGPLGDHLDVTVPGEAFDSGDKGTAKAMSVAYRIMLLQSLTLPTDDDDPDAVTHERSTSQAEAADLGKWRGMVAAAGRDKAALKVLWDQMIAEWDNVPWSPEREAVIREALGRANQPAEPAEPAEQAPPPSSPPEAPRDPDPNEAAAAEEWDANWRAKLLDAITRKDAKDVRALIKLAKDSNAPHLVAEGQSALDEFRANR